MTKTKMHKYVAATLLLVSIAGCKLFKEPIRTENKTVPSAYNGATQDTTNSANINWRHYFSDPELIALIDTALKNNQELNITMQEIQVSAAEVRARKGEYLPFGGLKLGGGVAKTPRYTPQGAVEDQLEVQPGKKFPEPIGDIAVSAAFSWELDIWKKLRNAKKAAVSRYLASIEGKNFMVTNLVAEISESYYELLTLDNQLEIINQNIDIQKNALGIIRQQKDNARVSQLAVNRFEAQLLNTQNLQYDIQQKIVETENHINYLVGRFPQPIRRNPLTLNTVRFDSIFVGTPAQLFDHRPDIRKAEQELAAAKLDVKVAKASFYPTIHLSAEIGFQAFNPAVWFRPESLLGSLFGDIAAPLINRNAIKAAFYTSRANQVKAVYSYEQTILKAYVEVSNQFSAIDKYSKSYDTKSTEVDILTQSITVSDKLFRSARADYMEVLLTQREALESRMQLIEIKNKQLKADINIYKALGGGWK
ncbi:MAG: efflux transporter outer membrane subunit [Bacteroidetes bacterium]|nr:efflux transporter outer membrane subunit [Bacteroidota bacterium]